MTCGKAFDIDVAAFVRAPAAPEWGDFRTHYPHCPTCAGEVRVWAEFEAVADADIGPGLDSAPAAHPAPADLLAFDTEGARMDPARRDAVEVHLADCRWCSDERESRRRFQGWLAAAKNPRPRLIGDVLARLRRALAALAERKRPVSRIVLHPAFAYAIVLAVLIPKVVPYSVMYGEPGDAPSAIAPGAPAPGSGFGFMDGSTPQPPPVREPVRVTLTPAAPAEVTAASADDIVLRVPVAGALRGLFDVEIRVTEARGQRELRERVRVAPTAAVIEVHVPGAWVRRGAYTVAAHAPDAPGQPVVTFSMRVD
jgi:hypothetical protein